MNRVALLITNIKFTNEKLNRNGAEKDEENMEKLLKSLGYEVVKHTNLTGKVLYLDGIEKNSSCQLSNMMTDMQLVLFLQAIEEAIINFSKHPKLKDTDSVLVVIMSHGILGAILGVDSGDETQDAFPINNIYRHFRPEKCPALLNKPKIIIIQACRGGDLFYTYSYTKL